MRRSACLLCFALLGAPIAPAQAAMSRIAPKSVVVTAELDPAQPWVRGTVQMRLELADSARTLVFDAESLGISRVAVRSGGRARTSSWAVRGDSLLVDVLAGLAPGTTHVEIGFEAPLRATRGWVRTATGLIADFPRGGARRAMPCVDDTSRASWRWHVQVPATHRTRSDWNLLRRERDRSVEVTEWRSPGAVPASATRFEVRRRVPARRSR